MAGDERRDQMVWSWLFLFFKVAFVHKLQLRKWAAIPIVTDKQWWEGGQCEWWYINCASSAMKGKKSILWSLLKIVHALPNEEMRLQKEGSLCTELSEYTVQVRDCLPRNWQVFGICSLVTWGQGHGSSDLWQLEVLKSETPVPMDYWNLNRSQHPFNRSQLVGFLPCPSSLWIFWDFI